MLEPFGKNIWIVKTPLKFVGLEIGTRMTVIRLNNGELLLHSPVKLTDELSQELQKLGTVKYIVSPNKLHHLFMADYLVFPQVKLYASPGLRKKRKDLKFECELGDAPEQEWQQEVDQMVFRGSFFLKEVVFFHKESKTLIFTDIIQEHEDHRFLPKLVAKCLGVYKKKSIPMELRLTMTNKRMLRKSISQIKAWDFDKIIFSHANSITENAKEILNQQF